MTYSAGVIANDAGNVYAAVLNLLMPGLGLAMQQRYLSALLVCATVLPGYYCAAWLFPLLVAVPVHFWSILTAARWRAQI
ncbi:MAG: hypothetical protein AAFZ65_05210 [Planctomycetota bacterium]